MPKKKPAKAQVTQVNKSKEVPIPPTKTNQEVQVVPGNIDVLTVKLLSMINSNLVDIKLALLEKKDGGSK